MAERTPIEWCDSAVNPVMGCDGCELWQPAREGMTAEEIAELIRTCYAGQIHEMRGGNPGYADEFLIPKMFPGRMAKAARWKDLRGVARPDKPWLSGLPRHVFISDMGDALSADVPFDYLLAEVIRVVAGWPHVGMWLTKQPGRMAEFDHWLHARGVAWPRNLWAGTSITQHGQGARLRQLRKVRAAVRFCSVEPIIDDPGELDFSIVNLAILGGESGKGARETDIATVRALLGRIRAAGCSPFLKQLGTKPLGFGGDAIPAQLRDRKGGDMTEWPADLRVRQWPVTP